MSNTTLHWQMRDALPHLRDGARLAVLTCYILHGNERNRAWPSVETLMKETGFQRAAIVAAKKWLVEHGALEKVTRGKRVGVECDQHQRIDMLQLTGKLMINGKTISLLYLNEQIDVEINSSSGEPLEEVNSLIGEPINSSPIEISPGEPKDVTSSKGVAIEDNGSTGADKKPRPRNLIFDAVALGSFGISDTTHLNGAGGRVGKISAWLKSVYGKELSPMLVEGFYAWYKRKYPEADPPRDDAKFREHWLAYWQAKDDDDKPVGPRTVKLDL